MSTEKIRELNDKFRTSYPQVRGGKFMLSNGISALSMKDILRVTEMVVAFDDFTEDNDPHGEHDFGSFQYMGRKIYFKIDYYDENLEYGSEDPSDPKRTTRVLTILFAEEY